MISPLFLWKKCLGPLCIAIWALPLIAIAAVIITDEEAGKKNLDSIYIGTIVATIHSTSKPTSCIPSLLKFGPFSASRLTLGPNHNPWYEPNPFFLALVGGKEGVFLSSVQSSLTSKEGNKTWWSVQGWKSGAGAYQIEGTMVFDVDDDDVGQERNQLSGVWEVGKGTKPKTRRDDKFQHLERDKDDGGRKKEEDLCAKGRKQLLRWKHKKSTTILKGHVSPDEASMKVIGEVVLTLGLTSPEDEGGDNLEEGDKEEEEDKGNRPRQLQEVEFQDMTYTLVFSGKHHSDSAPLPTNSLVWSEAGSGPPMKPYKFFTLAVTETSTTSSKTTAKPTRTRRPTSSTSTTTSGTVKANSASTSTPPSTSTSTPTTTPTETDATDVDNPLPKGAVVGIVVGGVLTMLVFAVMIFFLKKWRAKRKEPKFYPELAYIYSTPFSSTNKRTGGGGMSAAGESSAYLAGSRGTTSYSRNDQEGGEQGTYFGPPAPQLEVDLGDRAPFLDNNGMGSPDPGVVAGQGPGARGFGSPEQQQAVGGVGYGGHSRLEQEPDDLEHEMHQPMLSPGATYHDQYRGHGHHMGREF